MFQRARSKAFHKPLYVKNVAYDGALCDYVEQLENTLSFINKVKTIFEQRGFVAKGLQAKVEVCKKKISFFNDDCCDDYCSTSSSSSDDES
jgi:hypothetical protein